MLKYILENISISNVITICFLIYIGLYWAGFTHRDVTDSTISRKRSGLSLYTDYGTGCQYVKSGMFSNISKIERDKNFGDVLNPP